MNNWSQIFPDNSLLFSLFFCWADFLPVCLNDLCFCFLWQSEHQTLSYGQTECGKGKCPYDPLQKTASAVVGNSFQDFKGYCQLQLLFFSNCVSDLLINNLQCSIFFFFICLKNDLFVVVVYPYIRSWKTKKKMSGVDSECCLTFD